MKLNLDDFDRTVKALQDLDEHTRKAERLFDSIHYIYDYPVREALKTGSKYQVSREDFKSEALITVFINQNCKIIFVCSDNNPI